MPTIIGQVHYNYHSQVPPSTSSGQHSRTRHNRNQKRKRGAPKKGYRRDDTLRSADPRVAPPQNRWHPRGTSQACAAG